MSETSGTPQAPASQGTRTAALRIVKARETNDYPLEEFIESRGFRPEIQGLRAFAVLLVVLYHVWFGKVSGGVDVFLFISAFLLSLSFMRKINEGKPLNLFNYWLWTAPHPPLTPHVTRQQHTPWPTRSAPANS